MPDDISQQPLARALLAKLAQMRDEDHPLGGLAKSVLSGELGLREAGSQSWHGQGLGEAFAQYAADRQWLSTDQLADVEQQAGQLRAAGDDLTVEPDDVVDVDETRSGPENEAR
ncbi:hypothetical protein [Plantactinospora sp. B5E13]|uniref:hypothetical protein n=1 Tax=unclassified Plantactinospora TaxID=2631981 RepID=UPI00325E69D1